MYMYQLVLYSGWYYDLFDTLRRNRQITGDFRNIAGDVGKVHNELLLVCAYFQGRCRRIRDDVDL